MKEPTTEQVKVFKKLFNKAERGQLIEYVVERKREGWYYGNKEQFEKREERILNILSNLA